MDVPKFNLVFFLPGTFLKQQANSVHLGQTAKAPAGGTTNIFSAWFSASDKMGACVSAAVWAFCYWLSRQWGVSRTRIWKKVCLVCMACDKFVLCVCVCVCRQHNGSCLQSYWNDLNQANYIEGIGCRDKALIAVSSVERPDRISFISDELLPKALMWHFSAEARFTVISRCRSRRSPLSATTTS